MVGARFGAATAARLGGDPAAPGPKRILGLRVRVELRDLLVRLAREVEVLHLLQLLGQGLARFLPLPLAQLRHLLLEHLLGVGLGLHVAGVLPVALVELQGGREELRLVLGKLHCIVGHFARRCVGMLQRAARCVGILKDTRRAARVYTKIQHDASICTSFSLQFGDYYINLSARESASCGA